MLALKLIRALRDQDGPRPLPFQRAFVRGSFADGVDVGVLSAPRGSGKTMLLGRLAALAVTPGSPLWHPGEEVIVVAGSIDQGRLLAQAASGVLPEDHLRWSGLTSSGSHRIAGVHVSTGTAIRVISSSGKRAMGLGARNRLFLADEPASWDERSGGLMIEALEGALGKIDGSRLLLIGTRSPAVPDSWWPEMIEAGSQPGRFVQLMAAPPDDPWDDYQTIARANPVVRASKSLRRRILRERDEARRRPAKRKSFEAFRLNREVEIVNEMLVEARDWRRVERREIPPREGRPFVGLDIGASRSWSAAWALWENGRSECYALCAGVPDLAARERQDGMPRGAYTALREDGVLVTDEGRKVARVEVLIDHLIALGIYAEVMTCDRFLVGAVEDAVDGRWPVVPRRARWSEASEDVAAFRALVLDGPLSIAPQCRRLAAVSLGQAVVRSDDQGSVRIIKRKHGKSRDDVAIAGVLAAGSLERAGRERSRVVSVEIL